jgi:16S rRNA C1402 (ribose-2'-O) methylase RsmI
MCSNFQKVKFFFKIFLKKIQKSKKRQISGILLQIKKVNFFQYESQQRIKNTPQSKKIPDSC